MPTVDALPQAHSLLADAAYLFLAFMPEVGLGRDFLYLVEFLLLLV
jgi:hypothetical protein